MLLSDRDLVAELNASTLAIDPFAPALVQPSSIDVRLDRLFRVFNNHLYTHIDPAAEQPDLTTLVEVRDGEPFVLHPGEFVLASTLELIELGDQLAGRLEGKALALDTKVPTPLGWTTMGELQVGDAVIGGKGKPTRVVAVTDVMTDRPCYRIRFTGGEEVVADASHLWATSTLRGRKNSRADEILTTRELLDLGVRTTNKVYRHRVETTVVEMPDADLPIDPYVLGVWLGDGTSSSATVSLGEADADAICAEMEARGTACDVLTAKRGAVSYRIGAMRNRSRNGKGQFGDNGSLNSRLRSLGLLNNKHIPMAYLRASVNQRIELLRGLLDTDGSVNQRGDQGELTFTNQRLSENAYELMCSLGMVPTRDERPAKVSGRHVGSTAYRLRFRPRRSMFYVRRKGDRARSDAKWSEMVNLQSRAIVSIEPVASVPVRCIQVEEGNGVFLITRSHIRTHNSSLGRLGLLVHSTAGFIDPGFSGHVTLELSNVASLPILLWPGMRIGQLCVFRLSSPAEHPYGSAAAGSHYQGQRGPTPSRAWQGWRTWPTNDSEGIPS